MFCCINSLPLNIVLNIKPVEKLIKLLLNSKTFNDTILTPLLSIDGKTRFSFV